MPNRRYRRADGVESYYTPSPRRPAKIVNPAIAAAADEIAVNDGAVSHPLGDLSQHDRTFKLPRYKITDKSPGHLLQRESESEELADLNPTLAGYSHSREEIDLRDSKNIEEDTSSVIVAGNLDQQNDEKFLYRPEVSNPVDDANSEGPGNMNGGETAVNRVESISGSRRYERSWPRPPYGSSSHRSGYIPPSIAERISANDEPVNPTNMNVLARLGLASSAILPSSALEAEVEARRTSSPSILSQSAGPSLDIPTPFRQHVSPTSTVYRHRQASLRPSTMLGGDILARPAPAALPHAPMSGHRINLESDHIAWVARDIVMPVTAHVRNSTTDRELAFRRHLVAPHPGGDIIIMNHLQDRQPYPVAGSYDGLGSMHGYNTETPVEPSTLESIFEDAFDEPISTTPREEKTAERSYEKITASLFEESAKKAGKYLRGSPPPEPSVVYSDLQSSAVVKPRERELDVHKSRKHPADNFQAISSSEGVATKVGSLEQSTVSKRRWPPYKRILPVQSASSSIYSQPESPSVMSDIRAAFIRGKEDTNRYERSGYHRHDSRGIFEAISSIQYMEGADQKGTGQLTRSPEPKSPLESTNIKRPTSQYTALFARRPFRRASAMEHTRNSSTQRARRRKVPFKSQSERFPRRFKPGRSNSSLKNSIFAEELLTLKNATSEEYETNSTATDKQISTISENPTRGPKNWFEGVLLFHKKGTDQSSSLFINRKSDARLNKEVIISGFKPYDKHASHSGSIRKKHTEDTEKLIAMIETLERQLDEALYPAHKSPNAAVAVDVPQQQITGRVKARTRRSPIRHTSRCIQQDGSEGDDGIEKHNLRSRLEKVSFYGCDRNGAMRYDPPPVASSIGSNEVDNVSNKMTGALPSISAAPLVIRGASELEPREPERGMFSDFLSDNVTLNPSGNGGYGAETSGGVRMKPMGAGYSFSSGGWPLRKSPYKATFAVKMRKRTTVMPRVRERKLSKERILRFVKTHNAPPIQPRQSSRAIRAPHRDDFQDSEGPPTSQYSERALRVHTSMDGAHEADDEMESETEYITPRCKRNRANVRRHRISYEEAHHMHFLHGDRESSGQIFEWPPHFPPAQIRHDRGSSESSCDTQRVYVTARSRQNRGAADLSPADERLVTVAAGFSVSFIMLLLCVYVAFGPDNRYSMSI